MHHRAAELIERLDLQPHPEGGFYREIFRSAGQVTTADGRSARAAITTIYFLLPEGSISRWHRVMSDEVWHLYEGAPLDLHELTDSGEELTHHQLGEIDDSGRVPVRTIPAGHWQAARSSGSYTLVGCTVAPGFDFLDFQMLADDADMSALVREKWPHVAAFI
ncbi:MAG TPA: cupin domain-containing protein [Gemmatimonadaceae bacterium]|jgi:predicted cupin superfamily sugar epimerase|nr:cupin domain-containing protein [Gemmatimonadaceae bacterium]